VSDGRQMDLSGPQKSISLSCKPHTSSLHRQEGREISPPYLSPLPVQITGMPELWVLL